MSFRKERYPSDWKAIRARILTRAENKCETCRAPNGMWISREKDWNKDGGAYMTEEGRVFTDAGKSAGWARGSEWDGAPPIKVVLTVAHLDHVEANNTDDNLRALCQRCHLAHDREDNARRARETRRSKLAARDLFPGGGT